MDDQHCGDPFGSKLVTQVDGFATCFKGKADYSGLKGEIITHKPRQLNINSLLNFLTTLF